MRRITQGGPPYVRRPFVPTPDFDGSTTEGDKIAQALEHIARSLSAIDHNLEILTEHLMKQPGTR